MGRRRRPKKGRGSEEAVGCGSRKESKSFLECTRKPPQLNDLGKNQTTKDDIGSFAKSLRTEKFVLPNRLNSAYESARALARCFMNELELN